MSALHAPDLSAQQLAEIEAALAAVTSDWRPSGAPSGITYTDIFCGYGGSSIGLENAGLQRMVGHPVGYGTCARRSRTR